jgi:hypothetical protein
VVNDAWNAPFIVDTARDWCRLWRPKEPVEPLHNFLHIPRLRRLARGIISNFFRRSVMK